MAARKTRGVGKLPDSWKERIQAGVLMDRMLKCFNGEVEMTRIQLEAGKLILNKIEPDLARTDMALMNPDGSGLTINVVRLADNPDPK